jgi:hypothetical protein
MATSAWDAPVAWAVDDDEPAVLRVEVAPGDVDGDALLALGGEAVHQTAEVGCAGRRPGGALDGGALVGGERVRIPQYAADQGRLAVVHRAAGEDVEAAGRDRPGTGSDAGHWLAVHPPHGPRGRIPWPRTFDNSLGKRRHQK